jgi:branched-chain amino acid transport system substrate-binding protein
VKNYNTKYPNNPPEAYTAIWVRGRRHRARGDREGRRDEPADTAALRAAVLKAISETKDYEGALGKWSFNAEGDTTLTAMSGNIVQGWQVRLRQRHRVAGVSTQLHSQPADRVFPSRPAVIQIRDC